jgi:hypothetical protein
MSGSRLLLDELYRVGDEGFLAELRRSRAEKTLQAFGERWFSDPRPWARTQLLTYIGEGCDEPGHRPLVKKLFKIAEEKADDELMAHFLVAFDRMVKRRIVSSSRWDWASRQQVQRYRLLTQAPETNVWESGRMVQRFALPTRRYLKRRAFRYFRGLGRKDLTRYRTAVMRALLLYRDEDLRTPEALLDSWGLVHILYHGSPALDRRPSGIRLHDGHALSELTPAPIHPAAWTEVDPLWTLILQGRARTVRTWAISLVKRDHAAATRGLSLVRVAAFLRSPHDEVQTLGAELLQNASGLDEVPLADWFDLLKIENLQALPIICDLLARQVSPDRLSLEQCVELAMNKAAPVAELGLRWAMAKPIKGPAELKLILRLGNAGAPVVRGQAAAWIARLLREQPYAAPEHVRELLDARFPDAREAALALLDDSRFAASTMLFGALAESPYDDVRARLVSHLEQATRGLGPEALLRVWATSLLAVHRGGKAKQRVTNQIAERVVQAPAEADQLVPLLGIALRSIRASERRAALAAVSRAAFTTPVLRAAIARHLPELTLFPEENP